MIIDRDKILGAVARGWCHKETEYKLMDIDLAVAITEEVIKILKEEPDNAE